jgi:hypothetical protein
MTNFRSKALTALIILACLVAITFGVLALTRDTSGNSTRALVSAVIVIITSGCKKPPQRTIGVERQTSCGAPLPR